MAKKQTSYFDIHEFEVHLTSSEYSTYTTKSELLANLVALIGLLTQIRVEYGSMIFINSWYRSPSHNAEVGGSPTSQHLVGGAVDITATDLTKLIEVIKKYEFGQLIIYKNYLHLSLPRKNKPNNQIIYK